jgi:hypothetical protein
MLEGKQEPPFLERGSVVRSFVLELWLLKSVNFIHYESYVG